MLHVSFRNLLVRDAFKVVLLELAMSGFFGCLFWVVLLECTTSSLVIFHYDPKSDRATNPCYKEVCKTSS